MSKSAPAALVLATDSAPCCPPIAQSRIPAEAAGTLAQAFKALGDPTRIRLLSLISSAEGGEACICDLTDPVGLSQGTVSHHMKKLHDVGLVEREQRGKWAYFSLNEDALATLATVADLKGVGV